MGSSSKRFGLWLDAVATVAAVAACGVLVAANYSRWFPPQIPLPSAPVSLADASVRGSMTAPVVVIEYSDYQCPYCDRAETEIVERLDQDYVREGKVQFAMRQHPIEQLHPGSTNAAVAALCAGQQGRFWEMHRSLYANRKGLEEDALQNRAVSLSLDGGRFRECLESSSIRDRVRADTAQAEALGLRGTPGFLIGRRDPDGLVRVTQVIDGARPYAEFQKGIEGAKRHAGWRPGWWALVTVVLACGGWFGFARTVSWRRPQEL